MFKLVASWDDGCASDVRVAVLMKKYDIPTTFYWPVEWHSLAYDKGYKPLSYLEALEIASEFEVGSHTITHRHLTSLDTADAIDEIGDSRLILEDIFGKKVKKFCPPRGYTNTALTDVALQIYDSQRLTKGANLVHIHPNSGANDNKPWREVLVKKDRDVEIWGHSWELDKYDLWDELEGFLRDTSS